MLFTSCARFTPLDGTSPQHSDVVMYGVTLHDGRLSALKPFFRQLEKGNNDAGRKAKQRHHLALWPDDDYQDRRQQPKG